MGFNFFNYRIKLLLAVGHSSRNESHELSTSATDMVAPLCIRALFTLTLASLFCFPDSELEELGEQLPRYRPDSIAALRRATRFTEPELKRLYRGFKAECPTGVVKEDTFKIIYSQFFPQGGECKLNILRLFSKQ